MEKGDVNKGSPDTAAILRGRIPGRDRQPLCDAHRQAAITRRFSIQDSPPSFEELARRASELGFATAAEDYRLIENRLKALRTVLDVVRGVDVQGFEPASTFAAPPDRPS